MKGECGMANGPGTLVYTDLQIISQELMIKERKNSFEQKNSTLIENI